MITNMYITARSRAFQRFMLLDYGEVVIICFLPKWPKELTTLKTAASCYIVKMTETSCFYSYSVVRYSTSPFCIVYIPESGKELRSAHSTSGMALVSPETEDNLRLRVALSTMFFTSDRNIMVWTSFTSEYSGSQCMWALATRSSCFSMPWSDFPAEELMGTGKQKEV